MIKTLIYVVTPLTALIFGAGCDDSNKPPVSAPQERSQIVAAKAGDSAASQPTAAEVLPAVASSAPKPPRALCAGQMSAAGRTVAKKPVSQAVAAGEAPLPDALPLGGGYTWVNFWAAWCKPCKEEIPRLMRFQQELGKVSPGFKVSFVSLDDDERQLGAFLAEQASPGLRRTWWLKEGKEREEWLKAAGLESDPDLPFHLLFDPKGKLRCVVKGAVEDADLASLKQLVTQ
ncbi:MAG: Thiol-disulfide oxidoreductase [Polyangiaceae bacterium]|jgi:thiol-disulfide isomerase/thioredoxin|nr:Thiol-disulfide oxidoreductase [Polyangiaceae bacterium]